MIQEYQIELTRDCQIKTNKEIKLPTENQAVAHCTIINSTGEKLKFKAKCGDGENIINCKMDNNGHGFTFPRFSSTGYKELFIYGYSIDSCGGYEITYSPEPINFYVPKGSFIEQGVDVSPTERDEIYMRLDRTEDKLDMNSKLYCTLDELTIPESDQIGNDNIYYLLNDRVYQICANAFKNCSNLRSVSCLRLCLLEESVFEGCNHLRDVNLFNLLFVPEKAFKGCYSLKSLYMERVSEIGESAFEGCTSLEDFKLEIFHSYATNLRKELLDKVGGKYNDLSENDKKRIKRAEERKHNCTFIYEHAFKNCTSLKEFVVNEGTTLVDNAFEGCTSLEKVTLLGPVLLTKKSAISDDEDFCSYSLFSNVDEYRFPQNTIFYCYNDDVGFYSTDMGWRKLYEAGRIVVIDPPEEEEETEGEEATENSSEDNNTGNNENTGETNNENQSGVNDVNAGDNS